MRPNPFSVTENVQIQCSKLHNLCAPPCYLRREITNCSVMAQLCPGKEMVLQAIGHHLLTAEVLATHSMCLMGPRKKNQSVVLLRSSCLGLSQLSGQFGSTGFRSPFSFHFPHREEVG